MSPGEKRLLMVLARREHAKLKNAVEWHQHEIKECSEESYDSACLKRDLAEAEKELREFEEVFERAKTEGQWRGEDASETGVGP